MKKILAALLPALFAFAGISAWAMGEHIEINYSTAAAATYADGTPVLDGERFLLVWFGKGVTIDLASDITGDVNSFLGEDWWWVSYKEAKDGKCPNNTWNVAASISSQLYQDGRVQLYLLDTRVSPTELADMVENEEGDLFPSVINAVVAIDGATYSWTALDANPHTISGATAPATTDWTVFRTIVAAPIPVIVSMVYADGVVTVGATNTLASANYLLRGSLDLTFTNTTWVCDDKAKVVGAADALTACTFTDSHATNSAAFYRVEVAK